jgi:hypothetical protein
MMMQAQIEMGHAVSCLHAGLVRTAEVGHNATTVWEAEHEVRVSKW